MQRFLIIRPDRIGDAIITQVAIEFLFKASACTIDVLAANYNYQFYQDNPYISQVFYCDVENKRMLRQYCLANLGVYDAVFILQARRRLYLAALLSKCTHYFAFDLCFDKRLSSKLVMRYLAWRHNFSYINHQATLHEAVNLQALISHGLAKLGLTPNRVELPKYCRLYHKAITPTNKVLHSVVINVSGKAAEHKNLQPNMLEELLKYLLPRVCKIGMVVNNPGDYALALAMTTGDGTKITSVIEIISDADIFVVANKINSYNYFIGADGGLLHVAAALGLNCIGLYADSAKLLWAPWTEKQTSLSAPDAYAITPDMVINAFKSEYAENPQLGTHE